MIILHGTLVHKQFFVWAEDSDSIFANKPEQEKFAGASINKDAAQYLPFACPSKVLRASLMSAIPFLSISKAQNAQLLIHMPCTNGAPHPSSNLIGASPERDDNQPFVSLPWLVSAVELDFQQMIDLICYCADKTVVADGVAVGDDLSFWVKVLQFVCSLMSGQQVLPSVERSDQGAFVACWRPIVAGPDAERFAELSGNLPHCCLSLTVTSEPIAESPAAIVSRFMNLSLDFLVRSSFSDSSLQLQLQTTVSDNAPPVPATSIHTRWLHALWGTDSIIVGTPSELAELAADIDTWMRPLSFLSDTRYRLCFKFEEAARQIGTDTSMCNDIVAQSIADQNGAGILSKDVLDLAQGQRWFVRYVIQSLAEPDREFSPQSYLQDQSRKLPADSGGLNLEKSNWDAYEFLLSSMGYASRACPWVAQQSVEAVPSGFFLDNEQGYEFLSRMAPHLRNMGFGVQLPAWWLKRRAPINAKMNFHDMGSTLLGIEDIQQFDWQLSIGNIRLELDDLEEMVRRNLRLINLNGNWFELNPEHLQKILSFFRSRTHQRAPVEQLIKMGLGEVDLPAGVEFSGVSGEGRVVDLISQLNGDREVEQIEPHKTFRGNLRPYQQKGLSWLSFLEKCRLGACLADDMGLGKTVQTLAFIQTRWHQTAKTKRRPVLLVCPTSVLNNWYAELKKFTSDLPCFIHHGTDRDRGKELIKQANAAALVITSFALIQRDLEDLKKVGWSAVILDEAQNIKNPETKQAQAAFALPADFRIALTGTPVENNVGDLWSIMHFLNPGYLGKRADFRQNFYLPIQIQGSEEAATKLRKLTAPFILRRLKTDKSIIADLPEKQEFKVECLLSKEQAGLYATVVAEMTDAIERLEGIERRGMVLAALTKLKQICDHPVLFLKKDTATSGSRRSGKMIRLIEIIEEINGNGERAIVFTQFREMGFLIQRQLQNILGKEVLFLHGQLQRHQRESIVRRFQQEKKGPPVLVLSLKAGGTGLNLTRATQVIHFDRWWNPAVENQATDRAYRIGQTKNVQVHKFVCAGTLEENIDQMIENKQLIAAQTIGASESWITELSTRDLKELFALKQTVLAE